MTLHHPSREQLRLEDVLTALGHPVRLSIVRTLARQGECKCSAVPVGVSKSTATHHWRVLRESGVIRQQQSGRETLTSLRFDDIEARFPGLLDCVLSVEQAAESVAGSVAGSAAKPVSESPVVVVSPSRRPAGEVPAPAVRSSGASRSGSGVPVGP